MWDDLICPFDHGPLEGWGSWLSCRRCGRGYPVVDSIPTFLPSEENEAWRERQSRLVKSILATPKKSGQAWSAAIRERGRVLESWLNEFIELGPRSRVLQVGLRGQGEIHHFSCGIRYGIDPLAGVMADQGMLKWGQVRWASARGEEMPFPADNFQAIILSDILGSVESPERVLAEAQRCLNRDGVLLISFTSRWDRQKRGTFLRLGNRKLKPLRRVNRMRTLKWCRQAGFELLTDADAIQTHMEDAVVESTVKTISHRATPYLILRPAEQPVAGASGAADATVSSARQLAE